MEDTINILVLNDFNDEIMDRFKLVSPRLKFTRKLVKSANDVSRDMWGTTDILYTTRIVPEPDIAPRLRWVQVHSAGVDTFIDHPLFSGGDVALTNTSGIHAVTMAEFTFAMILAFARKIPTMLRLQSRTEWPDDRSNILLPRELRRSTLGIVGYGSIGQAVAKMGRAFRMEILATRRSIMNPDTGHHYEEEGEGDPNNELVDRLYPPEALKSMVSACDFVVVSLPLVRDTRGMINAEVFAAMKKTAIFINVARGPVVDEEALVKALQSGQIAGAGLDVFVKEPLPATSPLWGMSNVIISPHIAGNTDHYHESAAEVFIQNLERYLERRELLNRVDVKRGY